MASELVSSDVTGSQRSAPEPLLPGDLSGPGGPPAQDAPARPAGAAASLRIARTGGRGDGRPPFANRGVETNTTRTNGVPERVLLGPKLVDQGWSPIGAHLDFFTGSLGSAESAELVALTTFDEAGHGRQGFGASEKRLFKFVECWRRWEPVSASKRWGLDYENWEVASGGAALFADLLAAGRGFSPSRVDFAWTFKVPEGLLADHLAEVVSGVAESQGMTMGISGQGGVNTWYVGSACSERRLRIYRKDLQDWSLLEAFGSCMRIEVVLRDRHARAWWDTYERDRDEAAAAAAAHVEQMCGIVVGDVGEIPPAMVEPPADVARSLAACVVQFGDTLFDVLKAGGVDDLIEMCEAKREASQRVTKWRSKQRQDEIRTRGLAAVLEQARSILSQRAAAIASLTGRRIGAARGT